MQESINGGFENEKAKKSDDFNKFLLNYKRTVKNIVTAKKLDSRQNATFYKVEVKMTQRMKCRK